MSTWNEVCRHEKRENVRSACFPARVMFLLALCSCARYVPAGVMFLLALCSFSLFHFFFFFISPTSLTFVGMACFAAPSAFATTCVRASRASGASASSLLRFAREQSERFLFVALRARAERALPPCCASRASGASASSLLRTQTAQRSKPCRRTLVDASR